MCLCIKISDLIKLNQLNFLKLFMTLICIDGQKWNDNVRILQFSGGSVFFFVASGALETQPAKRYKFAVGDERRGGTVCVNILLLLRATGKNSQFFAIYIPAECRSESLKKRKKRGDRYFWQLLVQTKLSIAILFCGLLWCCLFILSGFITLLSNSKALSGVFGLLIGSCKLCL